MIKTDIVSPDLTQLGNGRTSFGQTFNIGPDQIELWLTNVTGSTYVYMQQIYLDGFFFTSNGQPLPNNPTPVLYRPYYAPDTLLNGDNWGFYRLGDTTDDGTLYSTSGGLTLNDSSTVTTPTWILVGGQPQLVQEVDSVLTLGGNGSGSITIRQYETPGSASKMRADYTGQVSALGQQDFIDASVSLGGLSD